MVGTFLDIRLHTTSKSSLGDIFRLKRSADAASEDHLEDEPQIEVNYSDVYEIIEQSESNYQNEIRQSPKRKRKKAQVTSGEARINHNYCSVRTPTAPRPGGANPNPYPSHPVDLFFSAMAEVVKNLPPQLVAEARTKVCQVVSELECKALDIASQSKFNQSHTEPAATTSFGEKNVTG